MAFQQGDAAHASVKRKGQDVEETHPVAPPSPADRCVRGKRKLSGGCSSSLPITVSTNSESSADEGDGAGNSPGNYTEATFTELVGEADAMAEEVVFFDVTVRQYGVEVEESDIVDTQWHIARISGNSPSCRARFRSNSRPVCGAYVARQSFAKYPAPTFRLPNERSRFTRFANDEFWSCLNDVCAFGKLAQFLDGRKPRLPSVWPVARGTSLSQVEVDELTKFGFRLVPDIEPVSQLEAPIYTIRSVLDVESFPEDLSSLPPDTIPKTRAGRPCNRRNKVSKVKLARIKVAQDGSIVLKARKAVIP
ncbi:hypothetical protein R1sor_021533 [Riccia sorocarpa]|uniref:Uncharacterized protein n=1 Tax=Riccia sorocarpa TaxID=122646 RepID=A0ABD3GKA3_9MARC